MEAVIKNKAHVAAAPNFAEIGLEQSVLEKCIVNAGLAIFSSQKETFNEESMASTIKYVLENDTYIKGTLIYIGEPEFNFHEIKSAHSIVMNRSAEPANISFAESNKNMVRRSADLVIFKNETDSNKDIDDMLELALTGCCVFGQVAADSVAGVVERIRTAYPTDKQYSKIWDFIEATGMVLCQRIVESVEGNYFSVWEYLKLDKGVKELLFKILDSAEGTEGVVKTIKEIVSNGDFDSKGFRVQADDLLKASMINENVYKTLKEADM